jgi:cytidine deaminase
MTDIDPMPLLEAARKAAEAAYCPYSNFRVGAAVLASDGRVFRACNVENASFGLTICAERAAFFAAVAAGCRQFAALALVAGEEHPAYPCGACRQVMVEFCDPDFPVFAAAPGRLADYETLALRDLLPSPFAGTGQQARIKRN